MYIPGGVVGLIVDQLASAEDWPHRCRQYLQAVSLVSTVWVDRCQHHLLSTISFSSRTSPEEWCSRIRPGPDGVSRHVRTLSLLSRDGCPSVLVTRVLEPALPHLTSFPNLRELNVPYFDPTVVSLDILVIIISSFADSLQRLLWIQQRHPVCETWTATSTPFNLLPNLKDLLLSSYIPLR